MPPAEKIFRRNASGFLKRTPFLLGQATTASPPSPETPMRATQTDFRLAAANDNDGAPAVLNKDALGDLVGLLAEAFIATLPAPVNDNRAGARRE
jgi:hypothetical protein